MAARFGAPGATGPRDRPTPAAGRAAPVRRRAPCPGNERDASSRRADQAAATWDDTAGTVTVSGAVHTERHPDKGVRTTIVWR
ncbi:hypothetical protein GCM10018787_02380 [Streptomyces thermodiastaticus]|nr:hypothetical protein GCM10018787_02380 [Streptomyces thermodiastaticus]